MCKATATQQLIFELHLTKSKKEQLHPFVKRYNAGRPLKERLRLPHIKLAEKLLDMYYGRLKTAQGPGKCVLLPNQPLPKLRTSNGALVSAMGDGCSKRTIINYRNRLVKAGIITTGAIYENGKRRVVNGEWRGTNSGYDLHINPMIMHLQTRQVSDNQASLFLAVDVKTFHHIETGNQFQVTNEVINRSGADFTTGIDNQSVSGSGAVENCPDVLGSAEKPVEKAATNATRVTSEAAAEPTRVTPGAGYQTAENPADGTQQQEPSPPSCAAPPQAPAEELPGSIEAVTQHLGQRDRNEAERVARSLWAYAHQLLYSDGWLANSIKYEAQVAITEYLVWGVKPGGYAKAAKIFKRRIRMVRRWLDRCPVRKAAKLGDIIPQQNERWIPLPNVYFDLRNQRNGFHVTQAWYNKAQQQTAIENRNEMLDRAVSQYQKSLEAGAAYGPDEAYQKITQTLHKAYPKYSAALIRGFQERIAALGETA